MNTTQLRSDILALYLYVIILVWTPITPYQILLTGIPIVLLILGIHLKKPLVGLLGLSLYYLLPLSTVLLTNIIDEYLTSFLQLFTIVFPSILLLSRILQLNNPHPIPTGEYKKPFLITLTLFTMVIIVFLGLLVLFQNEFIISQEAVGRQTILLASLTTICCIPLFLYTKHEQKK